MLDLPDRELRCCRLAARRAAHGPRIGEGLDNHRSATAESLVASRHQRRRNRAVVGHLELHDLNAFGHRTDVEEREANRFAAALLVPEAWIRERFIALITSQDPLAESAAVSGPSSVFNVSVQAMGLRLMNLGLIDPA